MSDSSSASIRQAIQFSRGPLEYLDDLRGRDDRLVHARFVVGPRLTFVVDPSLVRRVLVDDDDRYRRPDIQSGRTTRLTANGLIESEGSLWRGQRRRLQVLFSPDKLAEYGATIGQFTEDLRTRWSPGERYDLYREMTILTARVIAKVLFSTSLDRDRADQIVQADATIGEEFEISPLALLRQFLPTAPSDEYQQVVAEMHDWAEEIIEDHRRDEDPPDDLVTAMLHADEQPDVDLPPNQTRDEILTFLFAGHETTALTLAYAIWYVASNPEVGHQLRTEARRVFDGDTPDWDHLDALEYTERVVRETLRIRPPSWAIFRQAKLDSSLGRARISEGDFLLCPQWTLHRESQYFENPERFDPDRWSDRTPSQTPAYFPFGAGPHACIGGQLAITEAKLVLAALFETFDFEVTGDAIDDLRPAGVLQPRNGVPAVVRRPTD
jgi:cytochrome P450